VSWATALVVIVAIVVWGLVLSSRHLMNARRHHHLPPEGPSPRERELEDEVNNLRERLKVLERIATEDRAAKRLSSEIEQLRDE